MLWRETSVMDERLRFVARFLEGEGMSEVCPDFDISRKTGYKISIATGETVWKHWRTDPGVLCAMPINCSMPSRQ